VDLHRLASTSSAIQPVPRPRPARARNVVIASALLAVLALAVAVVSRFVPRPPGGKLPAAAQVTPSIAVLPFVDMSPGKDQEYFSDGLAEELLNDLAKIPGLQVTARTSSFQFKGKNEDLRTVGQKLNVRSILEGSVRKDANRVRITVQLINVQDGFHLWSETYDRKVGDIFAVQEEIARSVAGALKVTLLGGPVSPRRGVSEQAYNAYLQGRYFYQRSSQEGLGKAISYYEQAIKLDPGYARAWAGLAEAHSRQADWGYLPVKDEYAKALAAAERALALDPSLPEAHAAVGWIKANFQWDWGAANAAYQQAMDLEPGNVTAVYGGAVLALDLGHVQESIALFRRSVEFDPLNPQIYIDFARAYDWSGRVDEAVAAVNKALEIAPGRQYAHVLRGVLHLEQSQPQEALVEMKREPDDGWRLFGLALAYHALERNEEADAALAELIAKYKAVMAFQVAQVYAFRGQSDLAFQWLERAYAQRDAGMTFLKGDPLLKNLKSDPRYAAFLARMHLST